ncbi:hypothetical protein SAMN04515649_1069 [Eubacterium callanderi]|uniref:Uncharacterized protein n=1 Tax=Eubacterium callanderi TaxID=53442 RepID=A0AB74EYX0_9FIRM|nr:hypothetical protein [Eubacterium callanderi]SHL56254.1 hypothetical protein SAMN04515649_1069 [Eubacterium callanderi]
MKKQTKEWKEWLAVIIISIVYLALWLSLGICLCIVAYGMGRIIGGA